MSAMCVPSHINTAIHQLLEPPEDEEVRESLIGKGEEDREEGRKLRAFMRKNQ